MKELSALLARHCGDNITATAIPRLTLSRSDVATELSTAIYYPLLCIVAQGRKRVFLGKEVFYYNPETYLVASTDLPVSGQVIEAPYLGMTLALDAGILAEVLLNLPVNPHGDAASMALAVTPLEDDGLLDPILRLLRLLDEPTHIPALAPLIEREILYRLLLGSRGEMVRQLATPSSQLSQISRAIGLIRQRFDQSIRIDELAREAGMSAPSFHRHFRAVTTMSPLQFQKQIRLQEARRKLLSSKMDAASVGFDVGYESASQFSREYRRLFGAPPGRDMARRRRDGNGDGAAARTGSDDFQVADRT
ncbi:MAG: AraC family transcriptional regulator [Chthoniobacter sp.]